MQQQGDGGLGDGAGDGGDGSGEGLWGEGSDTEVAESDEESLSTDTADEGQDKAILTIRKGLVNHSMVSDPEINLSATLVELAEID